MGAGPASIGPPTSVQPLPRQLGAPLSRAQFWPGQQDWRCAPQPKSRSQITHKPPGMSASQSAWLAHIVQAPANASCSNAKLAARETIAARMSGRMLGL